VIVADASALVAIGDEEVDADNLLIAMRGSDVVMSAINYVETGIVLIGRRRLATQTDLDQWLVRLGVSVQPSESLGPLAMEAYLRFGRGFHPAKLNLADCFAYALAKALDAPLLYKGDDFTLTDVRAAL
jgi:ribonuclease VapC